MSINSGHASPLDRAILQLNDMIDSQRGDAFPAPFNLYRAKRILERFRCNYR